MEWTMERLFRYLLGQTNSSINCSFKRALANFFFGHLRAAETGCKPNIDKTSTVKLPENQNGDVEVKSIDIRYYMIKTLYLHLIVTKVPKL